MQRNLKYVNYQTTKPTYLRKRRQGGIKIFLKGKQHRILPQITKCALEILF